MLPPNSLWFKFLCGRNELLHKILKSTQCENVRKNCFTTLPLKCAPTGIALLTLPTRWKISLLLGSCPCTRTLISTTVFVPWYSWQLWLYSNLFPYLFNSLTNTLWTTWERLSPAWHLTVTDLSGCILWFTRMATVLNGNKTAVLPQGPRIMPGSLEWNGPLIIKGKVELV